MKMIDEDNKAQANRDQPPSNDAMAAYGGSVDDHVIDMNSR